MHAPAASLINIS